MINWCLHCVENFILSMQLLLLLLLLLFLLIALHKVTAVFFVYVRSKCNSWDNRLPTGYKFFHVNTQFYSYWIDSPSKYQHDFSWSHVRIVNQFQQKMCDVIPREKKNTNSKHMIDNTWIHRNHFIALICMHICWTLTCGPYFNYPIHKYL